MQARPQRTELQADFLTSPNGRLFTLCVAPPHGSATKGCMLFLPPFAEEMNRSRHFMVSLARSLAENGITVLIGDLFGTGDSEGDFADADWNIWQSDIEALLDRALTLSNDQPLWIGGLRTGALLCAQALQCIAKSKTERIHGALFVHPVKSGAQFLTQFLRIRQAAAMAQGKKETVSDLRKRIDEGERLKVGGYVLNPDLARSLDRLKLLDLPPPPAMNIEWIEIGTMEKSANDVAQGIPASWRQNGLRPHYYRAEQFWAMQEPTTPMELVQSICENMGTQIIHA